MNLLRCLFGVEAAAAAITAMRHGAPLDALILDAPPVAAAAAGGGAAGAGAAAASSAIKEMRAHFAAVKLAPRRVSGPLSHSLLWVDLRRVGVQGSSGGCAHRASLAG